LIVVDVWDKHDVLKQYARYVLPTVEAFVLAKNELASGNKVYLQEQDERSDAVNFDTRLDKKANVPAEMDWADIGCRVLRQKYDADFAFVSVVVYDGDVYNVFSRYVKGNNTSMKVDESLDLIATTMQEMITKESKG